jgi:hypothetical protein
LRIYPSYRHAFSLIAWVVVALFAIVSQGLAATCGPATSQGAAPPAWQTYCWIDMTSYNAASVFGGGQPFSITLSDGSVLSFTLSGSSPGTTGIVAVAAPAWSGAATGNSAFLGIPGKPILYTNAGGTVNLTLSNIKVTPPNGVVSTGQYKLVVADAESSNGGESLTFVTNGGAWQLDDQVPPTTGTTYPTISGTGTSTFNVTGANGTVGAYIMGSLSPTTVNVQLVAGGLQGVMLAVQYSSITVNKVINGPRANAADQFTYSIVATSNGTILSSATSTGAGAGPFGAAVATLSSSVSATVNEQMAAGSVSSLAQYTTVVNCTNGASGSPTSLPSNQPSVSFGFGSTVYGDAIGCTFTNTAKPATVALKKITSGAVGGPFTFTATNLASAPAAITTTASNTATPAAAAAIAVSTYNTAVTITETAVANFTATAGTCTDANSAVTGNPASFGTLAANVLTIPAANVLAGAQITCTLTNTLNVNAATVAVQKVTLGSAGGAFTFSSTNLASTPAAITTASTGTAFPVVAPPIAAVTVGTAVTITETVATNFTITNATCVDNNAVASGNPAGSFGTRAGTVLTIPAANIRAKAQIVCTFTNIVDPAIPLVAVQKITTGQAGGPFSFTATNLTGALSNITTSAAATATPAAPNYISVSSILNPVTLTEASNPSFNLTGATCTDTNAATSGNPASFGSFAGNVMTIAATNLKPFAKIVCTFTNAPKPPTVTLTKTTVGAFGGPFVFTASNLASAFANITTTAASTATPAAPTPIQVTTAGAQIQITEAANSSFTVTSATCTDANSAVTGNPANFGTLAGNILTVPAANVLPAAQINCTFTNTAKPASVTVQKTTIGGVGGPFTFSVANLAAAPAAITTTSAGTPAPPAPAAITVPTLNSVVQISENANALYTITSASCTDANAAITGNTGSFGSLTGQLLNIPAANVLPAAQINCVFTNAAKPTTVALQKITAGYFGGPFSFTTANLTAAPANITTPAVNTPTPAIATPILVTSAGAQVQITEAVNGSFTATSATCSDANASATGNPASFGSLVGNVITIPAANVIPAAQINCTLTNTAKPATVAVQKTTTGAAGGPFSFTATNLAAAPANITTTAAATPAPLAPTAIAVSTFKTTVQITETANTFFTIASASCTDANSAVTGNTGTFGTLAGQVLSIPAANVSPASQITCVFTNAGNAPKLRLQKALAASGRLAATDQFRLAVTGTGAPAAVNTTGTAAAITSAAISFTATANTAYALTETMAPGSASLLTGYARTVVCTNANTTGTNVSSFNTLPVNFTIQAADDVSCVITNNGTATPLLAISKSFSTASTPVVLGQVITYTYTIANIGNVAMTNIQVKDMHGTPAVQIVLGGAGIKSDTLTVPGPLGAAASPDTTANDGIWSTLAPGATVQFTYTHTVTQAEIDKG